MKTEINTDATGTGAAAAGAAASAAVHAWPLNKKVKRVQQRKSWFP